MNHPDLFGGESPIPEPTRGRYNSWRQTWRYRTGDYYEQEKSFFAFTRKAR